MKSSDQGISLKRYTIIPRTLIFITSGDQVLLLKGAPTKRIWANLYNGIGGHIEKGEDPLTAARRELKEETGLIVKDLWLCATISVDTGTTPGIGIFVYRGECPQCLSCKLIHSSEGTLSWIPRDELMYYPLVDDLFTLLPRILRLPKMAPPISVLYEYDRDDRLVIKINE